MYVEGLLRTEAEALRTVSIRPGWRVTSLHNGDNAVTIEAERSDGGERSNLRAAYAVGADGSRSFTRSTLGLTLVGEGSASRDFSSVVMPRICSPRPAGLVTTPRSRTRSAFLARKARR